jgi:excisionase family DNA binding protein
MKLRYRYAEAAEVLGVSKAKIYRRIREGRLTPVYDGAQPFLTHDELVRYAATTQPNLEEYQAANPGQRGFQRKAEVAA